MKKKSICISLVIAMLGTSLLFAGCGKKKDSLADSISSKTEKLAEKADDSQKEEVPDDLENAEESDECEVSVDIDASFSNLAIGTYICDEGDELEERTYEISKIGGQYYIEYSGLYDFAGGELELLRMKEADDSAEAIYDVMIYPFSVMSFAGDYWGAGYECDLTVYSNGDVNISNSPFATDDTYLARKDGLATHQSTLVAEKNDRVDKVLGTWRCISERDGYSHEITMMFTEDGIFKAVNKIQDEVPEVYIGCYYIDETDERIQGIIDCELMGYGGMPYEFLIGYNDTINAPIVYDDYMFAEPFTYKEAEEMNLPFEKVEDDEKGRFTPGPGSRTSELEKKFKSFISEDSDYVSNDGFWGADMYEEIIDNAVSKAAEYTQAPIVEVDSIEDIPDGKIITIHCYEIVGEGYSSHTATWDWIYYDTTTGKYTDFYGEELDLD